MKKDIMVNGSKDLLSKMSVLQELRMRWTPALPPVFNQWMLPVFDPSATPLGSESEKEVLKSIFPETSNQNYVFFESVNKNALFTNAREEGLRVGVVLSGGPASGGHNVIVGLFHYMKKISAKSQLFGFLNGPHGIYSGNYQELDATVIDQFRNQGGFHIIGSGRHKIDTDQQKADALAVCTRLNLDGLVVVGGDDSNTNAAILAEYFKARKSHTVIVGCPKTIDGDLKNKYVETSFGFDTAVKTYSELIGNICSYVASTRDEYHFIRLMGRSASNVTLVCGLNTHVNVCLVGEEVQRDKRSLRSIVDEITDLIVKRDVAGKRYGVVLISEGLIEFIPEIGTLIQELNDLLSKQAFRVEDLTVDSQRVFLNLPESIRAQLLLDRDAHGNVQVSRIATESLLMMMVHEELSARNKENLVRMKGHFFGYEGRCALPSLFDSTYCYALGHTAGALVNFNLTGYMAVVRNLHLPCEEWVVAGCPLQWMMTIEKRHGKFVPVIKKYLVDLDDKVFAHLCACRSAWSVEDHYREPGPIQFEGVLSAVSNYSITPPGPKDALMRSEHPAKAGNGLKRPSTVSQMTCQRAVASLKVSPTLTHVGCSVVPVTLETTTREPDNKVVYEAFPIQSQQHGMRCYRVVVPTKTADASPLKSRTSPLVIGVVNIGRPASGTSNVVWGLLRRLCLASNDGTALSGSPQLLGFKGSYGLLHEQFVHVDPHEFALFHNDSGFEYLGVTLNCDAQLTEPDALKHILRLSQKLLLHGLVFIGDHTAMTTAAIVAEYLLEHQSTTCVVGVPASCENSLCQPMIESCVGFQSASNCSASIVGNLMTDAISAKKYWYIVRFKDHTSSFGVFNVAFHTHTNICITGEEYVNHTHPVTAVVNAVADVVCERADQGKNFGGILLSDALFSQLPDLKRLLLDINAFLSPLSSSELAQLSSDLTTKYDGNLLNAPLPSTTAASTRELLGTFPVFFHKELIRNSVCLPTNLPIESLFAAMVEEELQRRKTEKRFSGIFTPITYVITHQCTNAMPSDFDCHLGYAHGFLACIAVESKLTGYITSIGNLQDAPVSWEMTLVPLLRLENIRSQPQLTGSKRSGPLIGPCHLDLQGAAYMCLRHGEKNVSCNSPLDTFEMVHLSMSTFSGEPPIFTVIRDPFNFLPTRITS